MKCTLIFITLFFSSLAYSGTELPAQTIKTIATGWDGKDFFIWTEENHLAEDCTSGVLKMSSSHTMKSELLSIMLSAFHSGKKVKFYISGCAGNQMNLVAVKVLK